MTLRHYDSMEKLKRIFKFKGANSSRNIGRTTHPAVYTSTLFLYTHRPLKQFALNKISFLPL